MTFPQLIASTRSFQSKLKALRKRQRGKLNYAHVDRTQEANGIVVNLVEQRPMLGVKTFMFLGEVIRSGEEGTVKCTISFQKVNYSTEQDPKFPVPIQVSRDVGAWMKPIKGKHVQVRCSCEDFLYVWSDPNRSKKLLFGAGPKVPSRKIRNPFGMPGACKHLISMYSMLKTYPYVEELSGVELLMSGVNERDLYLESLVIKAT